MSETDKMAHVLKNIEMILCFRFSITHPSIKCLTESKRR